MKDPAYIVRLEYGYAGPVDPVEGPVFAPYLPPEEQLPPARIAGAGAEQQQQRAARDRARIALEGGRQGQRLSGRPSRLATIDVRSPQQFVQHPNIVMIQHTTLGIAHAWPHLPGRPPAAGWDGEPGPGAPTTAV